MKSYLLTTPFFIALAGCAPLLQAPLVYTSKVSIGVDLSATSTENPGLGINIGYKQLDAAYVPVAVARKCEYSTGDKDSCKGTEYKLVSLAGNNLQTDPSAPTEEEVLKAKEKVATTSETHKNAQAKADLAKSEYEKTLQLASQLDIFNDKLTALKSDPNSSKDVIDKMNDSINEAIAAKNSLEDTKKLSQKQATAAEASLAALASASSDYQDLIKKSKNSNHDNKTDAFSVFGSFDGNTKASAGKDKEAGAGLALGRIFSTGVASQNLTQGMRAYYSSISPADCIKKSNDLINVLSEKDRGGATNSLITLCQSAMRLNQIPNPPDTATASGK